MNERISNHNNQRTHEGALLKDDARIDVMGANGGRFERPLSRDMLLRNEIGKATVNIALMRGAQLRGEVTLTEVNEASERMAA